MGLSADELFLRSIVNAQAETVEWRQVPHTVRQWIELLDEGYPPAMFDQANRILFTRMLPDLNGVGRARRDLQEALAKATRRDRLLAQGAEVSAEDVLVTLAGWQGVLSDSAPGVLIKPLALLDERLRTGDLTAVSQGSDFSRVAAAMTALQSAVEAKRSALTLAREVSADGVVATLAAVDAKKWALGRAREVRADEVVATLAEWTNLLHSYPPEIFTDPLLVLGRRIRDGDLAGIRGRSDFPQVAAAMRALQSAVDAGSNPVMETQAGERTVG